MPESEIEAKTEFGRALTAIAADNTVAALGHMEKALKLLDNPAWYSYLGFCIVKERGMLKRGLELCQTALELEPTNPAHYLNLGKVHLVSGNRVEALRILREGMALGGNDEIQAKLNELGMRGRPLIASLPRTNPLNRYLGLILRRRGHR